MKFDPDKHHRRSIRLKGYDYTQPGAYFVTMVTFQRESLFGEVIGGETVLNPWGHLVDECWCAIPDHFPHVDLDVYVIMPNHVHGIVVIREMGLSVGARHASPLPSNPPRGVIPNSLGAIVGSVKSAVTRRLGREFGASHIWQRNYYERVIRDGNELFRTRRYIQANSARWMEDRENLP